MEHELCRIHYLQCAAWNAPAQSLLADIQEKIIRSFVVHITMCTFLKIFSCIVIDRTGLQ